MEGQPPATAESDEFSQKSQGAQISGEALMSNNRSIYTCRVVSAILSGCVCGILGYTGLAGFVFYFLFSLLTSLFIMIGIGFDWKPYFPRALSVWTEGISHGLMTYVLFWTIFYDIVYVY